MQREPLADHRAPAAGAELDDVALLLPPRPEEPFLQDELGPLQILAGVDPLDLVLVVDLVALHGQPVVDQPVRQVGQPVFAVQRRRRQRRQHRPDLPGGDDVRADVELPDLPHPRRRLRLLDDVHDAAVAVADHAAVGVGPVGDRGEQRQVGRAQPVAVDQPADRGRREERRVAVEDQQVAVEVAQERLELPHRVAGAPGILLDDVAVARPQVRPDRLAAVADDDVGVRRRHDLRHVRRDVVDDLPAAQVLQQHGQAVVGDGLGAGGEDDGFER